MNFRQCSNNNKDIRGRLESILGRAPDTPRGQIIRGETNCRWPAHGVVLISSRMASEQQTYLAVLRATYEYEPQADAEDELAIKENQLLLLLEQVDEEYVTASLRLFQSRLTIH